MEQKYLFIVARRAQSTYALMKDTCASQDDIDVVLDRRHGQRRRSSVPTQANRRGRDRRSHTIDVVLRQLGWVLVERKAAEPRRDADTRIDDLEDGIRLISREDLTRCRRPGA